MSRPAPKRLGPYGKSAHFKFSQAEVEVLAEALIKGPGNSDPAKYHVLSEVTGKILQAKLMFKELGPDRG